jgi:hypothetical protein
MRNMKSLMKDMFAEFKTS